MGEIKEKEFAEGETVYLVFRSAAEESGGRRTPSKEERDGGYFALESRLIKEIMREHKVSHIPFLAKYMKGFLSLDGTPFCVVDFSLFRKLSPTDEDLFLVLNKGGVALQVDDVLDFYGQSEVKKERIKGDKSPLFKWQITLGNMICARVLETDVMLDEIKSDMDGR